MPVSPSHIRRVPAALLLILTLGAAAGCGGDKGSNPIIIPIPGPATSTPAGALAVFEASYEQKRLAEYVALFTGDFHFRFSSAADPMLVAEYGTTWGGDDEAASTQHLFAGFTSAEAPFDTFGPATAIAMTLQGPQILNDLDHADSTRHYKVVVVPLVDLQVTVLDGAVETVYEISEPHDFHLVRGDAAVLSAGQPADSLHWYVRRWDDKSPASSAPLADVRARAANGRGLDRVMPVRNSTWGSIKDAYRR